MNSSDSASETQSTGKTAKRKALVWIAGIALGTITILSISVMVHKSSVYQSKISSMTALADRIVPESDWVEDRRLPVTGDANCISFDQDCYVLHRSWTAENPVDIDKIADQLGIPMEHTQYPVDCMLSTDDGGRTEICAYDSRSTGNWQIALRIRQR